jgi:AcrR family transcriptional regulator
MSPRPRKTEQQSHLPQTIKETAWRQIAESGAAALSLRAIAREIGITAPAIYNYFPDRDALVTALIVEAFESLGNAQMQAIGSCAPEDGPARLTALGLAYRQWAVTYPQRYQLIFGTPIPGYHAPAEITLPAATAAFVPLIETLRALHAAGQFRTDRLAPRTPALTAMLAAWSAAVGGVDVEILYAALTIASRVHGLVALEIGNQMPSFITDPGEVFRREIEMIHRQMLINPQEA